MTCVTCTQQWRVELCDLKTGSVKAVPDIISMDWQTVLNDAGQGTLMLATKSIRISDVFPHLTSVYILRTTGPDASPEAPVVEFAGIVEQVEADDNGTTRVGMRSIEWYLNYRLITTDLEFGSGHVNDRGTEDTSDDRFVVDSREPQNEIGASLVNYAQPEGIPLIGDGVGGKLRYASYSKYDKKPVLEAAIQLTQLVNGPDWYLSHQKVNGGWATTMHFVDEITSDPGYTHLRSDREANGYGLSVDASEHATHVWAVGEGEERDQLVANVSDPEDFYPRFDAAPAWTDVSVQETLDEYAAGYLDDHQDPYAVPEITVAGLDTVPAAATRLGYLVTVDVCYGAVSYRGIARIVGVSWRVADGSPVLRTFELVPADGSARTTVLDQTPCDEGCVDCG